MAQRQVDMLIGRLVTDDEFRSSFLDDPEGTLMILRDRGLELSASEISALAATDRSFWLTAAQAIDPRLRKASLHDG